MKKFTLIIASLLVGVVSYAQTTVKEFSVIYELDKNTLTATATGLEPAEDFSGDLMISDEVTYMGDTYTVTSIAGHAFENSTEIKTVTLPNTISSLGSLAFARCNNLVKATIPYNAFDLTIIPVSCFIECTSLQEVSFPSKLQYIDAYAFEGCNIASLNLSETCLVGIDKHAFYGNSSMQYVVFPDNSLRTIDEWAFAYCDLESVDLPNTVSTLGIYAFYHNQNLASLSLSNNLRHIPEGCFNGSILTEIDIPQSVEKISEYAFNTCFEASVYCHRLTPPTLEETDGIVFGYDTRLDLYVPESSLSAYQAAEGWKRFYTFNTIADPTPSNRFLCDGVYYEILEGADVAVTGACPTDKTVVIPAKVKYYETEFLPVAIADCAFERDEWLTAIELPSSVTNVGVYAFYGCYNLQGIDLSHVKFIDNLAFYECFNLKSVTLNTDYCPMGEKVFAYCSSLESIVMPKTADIMPMTFLNCSALKTVVMPNKCWHILRSAFEGCNSLTSIDIPEDVTDIDEYAFLGCTALEIIFVGPETPPTVANLNAFSQETYDNAVLRIPYGTYEAYAQSYAWDCFENIMDPASVDGIADDNNLPVEYYNMQGVKVENPQGGIFIRRQGTKTEKIAL